MVKTTAFDLHNFLLGLAWLGELDREQIRRLWFLDRSESTVEKRLAELRRDGLISARPWSVREGERTVPQLARWSLTPEGHAQVRTLDQYPPKPTKPRQKRLIQHDARTTEIIVSFIEWARPRGLSSLCVLHEIRLDPNAPRPVCDALLIMQFGPALAPHLVPWSKDPAIEDEERRRFAIEADNNTEPASVIRGKALAYRSVHGNPDWRRWWASQYGPPPIPVWVAPDMARCKVIHTQWKTAWPMGAWLIADDPHLQHNCWFVWEQGKTVKGSQLTFIPDPEPALPAPKSAVLPSPTPTALPASAEPAASGQVVLAAAPAPAPRPVQATPALPRPAQLPAPAVASTPTWERVVPAFDSRLLPSPPPRPEPPKMDWSEWALEGLMACVLLAGLAAVLWVMAAAVRVLAEPFL